MIKFCRRSHGELAKQLSNKISQLNTFRSKADDEYSHIKLRLEEYNKTSERIMTFVEVQFRDLREIINSKEKELKGLLDQVFSQYKVALNLEIESLENANSKTENLIDIVEFAISYPNSYFCEGKSI